MGYSKALCMCCKGFCSTESLFHQVHGLVCCIRADPVVLAAGAGIMEMCQHLLSAAGGSLGGQLGKPGKPCSHLCLGTADAQLNPGPPAAGAPVRTEQCRDVGDPSMRVPVGP